MQFFAELSDIYVHIVDTIQEFEPEHINQKENFINRNILQFYDVIKFFRKYSVKALDCPWYQKCSSLIGIEECHHKICQSVENKRHVRLNRNISELVQVCVDESQSGDRDRRWPSKVLRSLRFLEYYMKEAILDIKAFRDKW